MFGASNIAGVADQSRQAPDRASRLDSAFETTRARVIASRPVGARMGSGLSWFKERTSSEMRGAGRQVAGSRDEDASVPRGGFGSPRPRTPAPHSPKGMRLALRWSCQSPAVVRSGRASRERAHL